MRPSPPPARVAARASLLGLPAELLSHIALLSAPAVGPPSLLALALTHRTLARALSFDGNPTLYASLLARAWDIAPARRRFGLAVLADARSAALELRHRWGQTLRTVRAFADDGARWLEQHGQAEGVALLEQTMLEVFFLLTENGAFGSPPSLSSRWAGSADGSIVPPPPALRPPRGLAGAGAGSQPSGQRPASAAPPNLTSVHVADPPPAAFAAACPRADGRNLPHLLQWA